MEAVGVGLEAIEHALSSVAGWTGFVCIVGIAATTFLIYTNKVSFDDIKELFKKDKRGRY